MAAEMRELGLNEEELKNVAYMGKESESTNTSSKTPKKSSNELKHKKEKKGSSEKIGYKKKRSFVEYLNSPGSDSDSSSYESSVGNLNSYPRGLQYDQSFQDIGGRGTPFIPHAINNPHTVYSQGVDTHYHINRMVRDLNPLIQRTDSSLFRNETIEDIWGATNKIGPKTISNDSLAVNKKMESEITVLPIEPKQFASPVNIGKPLNGFANHTPEQPYKNALINVHKSETNSSSSDESNVLRKFDRLSMTIPSNNCDNVDMDNSIRKKREDRVKTQLYIPPHLRKRIAESETSDSTSDCSVATPPIKHQTPSTNQDAQPVTPAKPAKKSMEELTRKNALISGLLRKKQEQKLQSSPSVHCPSSAVSSSSANTLGVSSSRPSQDDVISTPSLSSSCRPPSYSDYCDTDLYSPPSHSEPSSSSPPELPSEIVEFYDPPDIVDPTLSLDTSPYSPLGGRSQLPLRPPPEFAGSDDSDWYCYYDEDTKQYVPYRIPESPSQTPSSSSQISLTAVNGSAFSSFNGSAFTSLSRDSLRHQSNSKSSPGSVQDGAGNARHLPVVNHGRGMPFSSPPSNPNNHASYSSRPGTGFWPPPSPDTEHYDQEYPFMR
uniref:Uncharacterized protein n=1 Tax=Cacopsylla melanoneura TaxID=428564 RepID=A0A8D8STG0_9HEMI